MWGRVELLIFYDSSDLKATMVKHGNGISAGLSAFVYAINEGRYLPEATKEEERTGQEFHVFFCKS